MVTNSIVNPIIMKEYNLLCDSIRETVKPTRLPFVTFFDAATAERNIKRNSECAIHVLAAEKLFLKTIAASDRDVEEFERAKSDRRAYYHTGLHLLLNLDILMPIELSMKLNLKDESEAYSDLVKFYRLWTGDSSSSNESNRRHGSLILQHKEHFLKCVTS